MEKREMMAMHREELVKYLYSLAEAEYSLAGLTAMAEGAGQWADATADEVLKGKYEDETELREELKGFIRDELTQYAADSDPAVRIIAAGSSYTPAEILSDLAHDEDLDVSRAALKTLHPEKKTEETPCRGMKI